MNPISIIAISGKQYSGKDQLTHILLASLPEFAQCPIAFAIKQRFARQEGLTLIEIEANKANYRPHLIALGDWGRKQDPDYWLKQVLIQPGRKIISDLRLHREFTLLRQEGAFLIRINADQTIRARRGSIVNENDPTECELDNVSDWDVMLNNNGTIAELTEQAQSLIKNLPISR